MRMSNPIPVLLSLVCPFVPSACEPTTDGASVEAARLVIADEPRRVRMGETMGSTSGDTTTGGEEGTSGATAASTTTGAEESTSSTTGDFPIADTEGCPWWGCDGLPGESWTDIITDCSHPKGQPEIGDAVCPAPKKCFRKYDFHIWSDDIPDDPGVEMAFCAPPCPFGDHFAVNLPKFPNIKHTDACNQLGAAMGESLGWTTCVSAEPGAGEAPQYCMMVDRDWAPGFMYRYATTYYLANGPYDGNVLFYDGLQWWDEEEEP